MTWRSAMHGSTERRESKCRVAAVVTLALVAGCGPCGGAPATAPSVAVEGAPTRSVGEPTGGVGEEGSEESEPVEDAVVPIEVDQSTPEAVIDAIFESSRDGRIGVFRGLCDREGPINEEARQLCAIDQHGFNSVAPELARGRREAPVFDESGERATVRITFGRSAQYVRQMTVVKRGDRWFISAAEEVQ